VWATLTAGDGVTITNGAGGIMISAPSGGILWSDEAVSFTAEASHGYRITANAVLATLTASPSLGDVVEIQQDVTAGTVITVVPAAADVIVVNGVKLTAGVGLKTSSLTAKTGFVNQSGCHLRFTANDSAEWIVSQEYGTWITTA